MSFFGAAWDYSLELSPDGRWLLYSSSESGNEELYLRSYPELDAPRTVSADGGWGGRWAPDGGAIVYVSPAGQVVEVAVGTDGPGSLGTPRVVQDDERYTGLFGVSPGGNRFLRRLRAEDFGVPELRIVTGWTERALRAGEAPSGS